MGFFINQEITSLFDFKYIADEVLLVSHVNVSLNDEEVKYFSNSLKQNVINILLAKLAHSPLSSSLDFVYARVMRENNMIIIRLNPEGYPR